MSDARAFEERRASEVADSLGLSTKVVVSPAIGRLEGTVLTHPQLHKVAQEIAQLHERSKNGWRPRALLFTGESGAGKTTVLNLYTDLYPHLTREDVDRGSPAVMSLSRAQRERLIEADLKRVVYIELNKAVTQRSLSADLLGAFGYDAPRDMNAADVVKRISFLVTALGTELILFDEAHYVVRDGNDDVTSDNAEFLKSLLNKVAAQIVLAGLPKLLQLRKHRQFWRRLEPDVALCPYDWHTVNGRVEFSSLLKNFSSVLGLQEDSGLHQHAFAKRIYVATGGEIGIVSKYLSQALKLATRRNLKCLTPELLGEVHEQLRQKSQPESTVVLDFDDLIDEKTVNAIEKERSERNPFTCSDEQLREIYLDTVAPIAVKTMGRPTGRKANGPKPHTPLSNQR